MKDNCFNYSPGRHKYLFDENEDYTDKYKQFACVWCGFNAKFDPRVNWFWSNSPIYDSENDEFCLKTKDLPITRR